MALHDYECLGCRTVLSDQHRSITEGATARPPLCPVCHIPMDWIPKVGRMDALEPFQRFTTRDGAGREVVIDSLHKLRQVEKESEQLARNGEGEHLTWRHYSNDKSNRDVNTHGDAPQQSPDPTFVQKFGKAIKSKEAPEVEYGPGVTDANTSALGGVD